MWHATMGLDVIRQHLPPRTRLAARKAWHYGRARRCPVCVSTVRRFTPFGLGQRPDACCPVCGSVERHRLAWLFLEQRTDLFDGRPKRLLHFAPEGSLAERLATIPGLQYVSADLASARAALRLDIAKLPLPDGSFDAVYCSHVLEHVVDDRAAMREVLRVLRPGGWAVFQVPITATRTLEDPTVIRPEDRLRRFGQSDHVRRYGADFPDRLDAAGFRVDAISGPDLVDGRRHDRFALRDESLYFCTRD